MTQEEKARAYDEAIERARKLYERGTITESLGHVFPELKESDDERVRKEIISYLKRRVEMSSSIPAAIGYWIAWLEKQGEQKPEWTTVDEQNLNVVLSHIPNECLRRWLKEAIHVRYNKPTEWSEEDEDYFDAIIVKLEVTQDDAGLTDNQMNFLKSLRPQNKWKPSDEQMEALKGVQEGVFRLGILESLYQDLKKLKE